MMIWLVSSSQIPIPPEKGGAIEKILRNIHDSCDNIFVVSSKKTEDGLRYVILPSLRISWPLSLIYEVYWGIKLFFVISKHRPRIVHFNTVFNSIFPFMLKFLLPRTKFVYTSHNPSWTERPENIGIINRMILILEKFIMLLSDRITAVSYEMYRGYVRYGINKKCDVIYNMVSDNFASCKTSKHRR